jgi:uncharacterized damage-inducible protein DinB
MMAERMGRNSYQEDSMTISEALLSELDHEMANTRRTVERVPADKPDFTPHEKSMPMGKLATHVVQLTSFGLTVLTTPQLDFSSGSFKPLTFESAEQLVKVLEDEAAKVRAALAGTTDKAWQQNWKLSFEGKMIFEASRFLAYRSMFLNHMVHHRAQLGVYLRLNGIPVPATYGPSADEPFKA